MMARRVMAGRGGFSPKALFAAGEQGVWYDPSDFSTLFQDAAGTTPVTAVEQPVGKILDKSGRGNHAFQSTSANRPVLSARVNLLTKTEQFDDAAWVKGGITVIQNTGVSPDGTTSADTVSSTGGSSVINQSYSVISGVGYKFSAYFKAAATGIVQITGGITGFSSLYANFDLSDGSKGTVSGCVAEITSAGNGWWKCAVTQTATKNDYNNFFIALVDSKTSTRAAPLSASAAIYIWGADLRVANDGVGIPAYQRVNTATDYDTTGFPLYLSFNGSNQWMQTNTITPGIDKAQVFAGVRKLDTSTAPGLIAELSSQWYTNAGTFVIYGPDGTAQNYGAGSRGTSGISYVAPAAASPASSVVSLIGNISGDITQLRINTTVAATNSTTDQGTGNYLAHPLYIGLRAGTTLPFNGHLYGLIVRFGANLSAGQIASAENYINSKTLAF